MTNGFSLQSPLERVNIPQSGTYVRILYAPLSYVLSITKPNPLTGTIAAVTLKAGKTWFTALMPPTSRGFTETQQQGEGGPFMDMSVNIFIPFETEANHITIDSMMLDEYVVVIESGKNIKRLIGTQEAGARFTHNFTLGNTVTETPGTAGSFVWQYPRKAPIINATHGAGPTDPTGGEGEGGGGPGA